MTEKFYSRIFAASLQFVSKRKSLPSYTSRMLNVVFSRLTLCVRRVPKIISNLSVCCFHWISMWSEKVFFLLILRLILWVYRFSTSFVTCVSLKFGHSSSQVWWSERVKILWDNPQLASLCVASKTSFLPVRQAGCCVASQ